MSCTCLWRLSGTLVALGVVTLAKTVVLSNTELPVDNFGNALLTGEATLFFEAQDRRYFLYLNNWGGCCGVDCCSSPSGCASCCFHPPSPKYPDACVYTANHSVVAYSTLDFSAWKFEGVVLALADRLQGVEFRPQVVYSPASKLYLMWYEDRWTTGANPGFSINAAATPAGPFRPYMASVVLPGAGRIGDFDLFVDDDGQGYHVRTGLSIVQLNATMTGPTGKFADISLPKLEGPAMFKRNGMYYILAGRGCCACIGGSNIEVYSSAHPLGPYIRQGDVGSRSTAFNASSPYNYVTNAQQTKVIPVTASDGSLQYLWLGNQWVTSRLPGRPRNNDLLYWSLIQFDGNKIRQFVYANSTTVTVSTDSAAPISV